MFVSKKERTKKLFMLTKTVILEFVASVLKSWNENLLLYESLIGVIISLSYLFIYLYLAGISLEEI